jgi:hypothetical protein
MDREQAPIHSANDKLPWGTRQPSAPIRSISYENAPFVVTIDGKPYAGFVTRAYAEMAILLWRGEVDGIGNPVPVAERGQRGWSAARGRALEIVERGSIVGSRWSSHP